MSHYSGFKRGDRASIIYGKFAGLPGIIESRVFQKTVDYRHEYAPGYQVCWTEGRWFQWGGPGDQRR